MKLVIQIPCLDEEGTLAETLSALPKALPGVDEIEVVVVDDGSTDRTSEVASAGGVAEVVRLPSTRGLARAFMAGIDAALRRGADVIVNTDADNQYPGGEIAKLVAPIVEGKADVVIGDRNVGKLAHFSPTKRLLQRVGSWVVRRASGTSLPDVTSGFRAFSREAALRLNVLSDFTYTLETIIQAGTDRLAIAHVPIEANRTERPSRLFSGTLEYLRRSSQTIARVYTMYRPLRSFMYIAALFLLIGLAVSTRFLYFFVSEPDYSGHVQSLILAAVCLIIAFQVLLFGLLADLVGANRKLLEDALRRLRRLEIERGRDQRPKDS
ncbi:MAG: glycosyltransferase family 2 protein [Deltaproteobacteria bacterium]|nr:glycosyltransferase family 2 protein [Deltaproteobacteria bacterium]